ncbi:MAG: 5'-nucleotidase C-terminal domain-containing protein [Gemmatimonadaceae bacterium]
MLPLLLLSSLAGATPAPRPRADTIDLVVASTTDPHGRLRGWDYYANAPDPARGVSRAATIVDSLRRAAPGRLVLVDAGDILQGNPLMFVAARVDRGALHPAIAAMNAMQYDAAAIGNHEFNYGVPALARAIAQATFPFLAANAYTPAGARAYPAYRLVERQGVRIAIVGATTPGSMVWDRDNLRGRVVLRDIVPAVRAAVAESRAKGADVVIVTVHSGLDEASSYDTVAAKLPSENVAARVAREVPGIDLVVYGHSHRQMADTLIGTTMLQQPKNWATSVGVAHLGVVRDGAAWRVVSRRGSLVQTAQHVESPAVLAATQTQHDRTVAYVTTAIGTTAVVWRADSARVTDTPITDFVLETMRRAAHTDLAATAAFELSATLGPGAITIADVAKLYPYDNTLVAVRITGKQLRDFLEFSARYYGTFGTAEPATDAKVPGFNFDIVAGADDVIELSKPIGSRLTTLTVKGRDVRDADRFTLALNNYRASGGGGYSMLAGAPVIPGKQLDIRQLLIDDVMRRKTLSPGDVFTRNWSITPAAAIAPALAAAAGGDRAFGNVASAPSVAKATHIRVVAINDLHGTLEPRADARGVRRGGVAALATVLEREEAKCKAPECAWLLLDGGDEFQGTPASNLAYGRPVVAVFNAIGVAASAVGNHEFDWGIDTLRARMREARYAMLGANVRAADGSELSWMRSDTIIVRGGVRVGIVGVVTTSTPHTTRPANVRGLQFLELAPVVDARAKALRERGAEVVIVIAHEGAYCDQSGRAACHGEIIDMAQQLTQPVDAIVGGHTHSLIESVVRGIPIVQARNWGSAVGTIDVPVPGSGRREPGTIDVVDVLTDSVVPNARIDSIVTAAHAAVASLVDRPVATLAEGLARKGDQYPLGNIIADAVRSSAKSDVGVMNNGGIRAELPAGAVSYGSAYQVLPLDNQLVTLTVSGARLRTYLEASVRQLRDGQPRIHVSGVEMRIDTAAAASPRIRSVTVGGAPLADANTYTVSMNDFMTTTEPGLTLAKSAASSVVADASLLDAFIDHLKSRPQPVQPPHEPRILPNP